MQARSNTTSISNSLQPPLYSGIEFGFEDAREFERYVSGTPTLGRYGRYDNETWRQVEERLARLEGTESGLLFASGMAAILTCGLAFVKPGTKVVLSAKCYRNTKTLFETYFADRMNVELRLVDPASAQSLEETVSALDPDDVSLVFIESPSNPHLYLTDIELLRDVLGPDVVIVVDATLASPINFKPTQHGADLALHSCTKYISGHGDVMGGAVTGPEKIIARVREARNVTGAIADPRGTALIGRSLETLALRMTYVEKTAHTIAAWLEGHPRCSRVFYTGLPSHPHHALAERCLTAHGGVVTFELDGDAAMTERFVDRLRVPAMASNFGSSRSLIEQCGFFTYYKLSEDERHELGISDSMLRLSLGYEPEDDVLADLAAAFDA